MSDFIYGNAVDNTTEDTTNNNSLDNQEWDDADSSSQLRLRGGDAPEVFHDIKPTGDTKNERSKVYKQMMQLNNMTEAEAIAQVDAEAEAAKIDPNLGLRLKTLRQTGKLDGPITSHEIYQAGKEAAMATNEAEVGLLDDRTNVLKGGYQWDDSVAEPTAIPETTFADMEKGHFGRGLVDTPLTDTMIGQGYFAPGTVPDSPAGIKKYMLESKAADKAKRLGLGLWEDPTQARIMQAIRDTSYVEAQAKDKNINTDRSYLEQLTNLPQAMLSGVGKAAFDVADTGVELIGDVAGKVVGLASPKYGQWFDDVFDLAKDDDKTNAINSIVGYDNKFTKENMQKVSDLYDIGMEKVTWYNPKTWLDMDTESLGKAVGTAFGDIETAGYSFGYMVPALIGAAGRTAKKAVGGVVESHLDNAATNLKLVATGKMTEEAAKKAAKESLDNMSKLDRTKLFLVNNADALAYGAMMNNDQMDEYIKNNGGEDATVLRSIVGTAFNALGMKLDIGVMNSIVKPGKDGVNTVINKMITGMGENKAKELIGKSLELATRAGMAGIKEMPQEWTQSLIEEFNSVYGTKKADGSEVGFGEAFDKSRQAAGVGSIAGLAGGVQTSVGVGAVTKGPGMVIDAVKAPIDYAVGKAKESMDKRAETKLQERKAAQTGSRNKTLDSQGIDFEAYTPETRVDNADLETVKVKDATGNEVEVSLFETPENIRIDAQDSATYEKLLESQKGAVVRSLYDIDNTGKIKGLSEEAKAMEPAKLQERVDKVNRWLDAYEREYTTDSANIPAADQAVVSSITEDMVTNNTLSDEQHREVVLSAWDKEVKGTELTPVESAVWNDKTDYGKDKIAAILEQYKITDTNKTVAKELAVLRGSDATYHVEQKLKTAKLDEEEIDKVEAEVEAAVNKLDELNQEVEDNKYTEANMPDQLKQEIAKHEEIVATKNAEADVLREKGSTTRGKGDLSTRQFGQAHAAREMKDRDVSLDSLSDAELENHYNLKFANALGTEVDGKVTYPKGWNAARIKEAAKETVKYRREIADRYNFDADVEVEIDYDGLHNRVKNAKQDKSKTVDSTTVKGNALADMINKGSTEEAIAESGIAYNENDSKVANRVLGKIRVGKQGSLWKTALTTMNKIAEYTRTPEAKKKLGSIFKDKAIEDGDGIILLTIAMSAIESSVVSDTLSRQTVDSDERLLRKDGYWASRTNLETQIGKDLLTSKHMRLVRGTPEQHAEQYRKIGRLALDMLVDPKLGLVEQTDGAMWTVLSKEAVTPKGAKITTANATFASTEVQSDIIDTEQEITIYANDIGVRIVGEKGTTENDTTNNDVHIPYANKTGDVMGRIGKLLTPNNLEVPSNTPSTEPIKTSPTVDPYSSQYIKIKDTIEKMQNTAMQIKPEWLELLKKMKTSIDEDYDGNLDLYLEHEGKDVAQMLGIDKYKTKSDILAFNDAGVSNGIKDSLRGVIDNLEDLQGDLYFTYQIDKNNRVTIRQTVLNFQADKVLARNILMPKGEALYDMGDMDAITETQQEMLNEIGFKAPKGVDAAEAYAAAMDIILGTHNKPTRDLTAGEKLAWEVRELITGSKSKLALSKALNNKKSPLYGKFSGKKTIKGIAVIDGFRTMRESDGTKTNYIPEHDAKASGVMNVLLNIVGFDVDAKVDELKVADLLTQLGVTLKGGATVDNIKDAYNLLQDKVKEVLAAVGDYQDRKYEDVKVTIAELEKLGIDTRELAKPPVMTWFYTAGSRTIVNELTQTLMEQIIRKAIEGNPEALAHINRATGKNFKQNDISKIKIGDADYKKLRDEYIAIGKLYEEMLDKAFPGVKAFKETVKKLFLTIEDTGYGNGILDTAAQALYGGKETGTFGVYKEKMYVMDLDEESTAGKPTLKDDRVNKRLVTGNKAFANFQSLIPLIAQGVDFSILEKTLRQLYKKYEGKEFFGPMTVHDAIYLAAKYMKDGRMEYNRAIMDVATRYDFMDTVITYGEDTLKRIEKDLPNLKGEDKTVAEINMKNLAAVLKTAKEVNGKRILHKKGQLEGVETKLFGEVELKTEDDDAKTVYATKTEGKVRPKEVMLSRIQKLVDNIVEETPFDEGVEVSPLEIVKEFRMSEFGLSAEQVAEDTIEGYKAALGIDEAATLEDTLLDEETQLEALRDPKESARQIGRNKAMAKFRAAVKTDKKNEAISTLINELAELGDTKLAEVKELAGDKVSWVYDADSKSKVDIKSDGTAVVTVGKETLGEGNRADIELMTEVLGHEVEHAATNGTLKDLANSKGTEDAKKAFAYLQKVLTKLNALKDAGKIPDGSRLARILAEDEGPRQMAELVATVRGEVNGGVEVVVEMKKAGIATQIAEATVAAVKKMIAIIRNGLKTNGLAKEYEGEVNIDTMLQAIEEIHQSAVMEESTTTEAETYGYAETKQETGKIDKQKMAQEVIARLQKVAEGRKIPAIEAIINKIKDC